MINMCSNVGTSISSSSNVISSNGTNIKGINFSSNWSGSAYEQFNQSLNDSLSSLESLTSQLSIFNQALSKLDEYKAICGEIARLESELACISGDDEEAESVRASIEGKIASLVVKKNALRAEIESILSSITGVMVQSNMISYTNAGDFSDLVIRMEQFNKLSISNDLFGALTIKDANGNIIRDGETYFNESIDRIRSMYTGSDKTYFTTLKLVDLCLEAGVRPSYRHAGTGTGGVVTQDPRLRVSVPSSAVSSGTDCNAIASFLVFNDDSTGTWLSTTEFANTSNLVVDDYSGLPGFVCTKQGHVAVLMGYDTENDQYMIYEAKGYDEETGVDYGHQLTLMNGPAFRGVFTIRDIDSSFIPDWMR